MPRKKKDEEIEETQAENAAEETSADHAPKSRKSAKADDASETGAETPSIIEAVAETFASAVETVVDAAAGVVNTVAETVGLGEEKTAASGRGNRSEKIGVVASDKMQKTVTVRVDRLVKHPMYRKYVRRRKKFMAHDELGATVGDKVRIVETRPLSAHKRWRVVEIIQKAEK